MAAKKHKPAPAELPSTPSPGDLPDGFRMVEVEPGRWIGLPTFDISEWFDSCEIPSEERARILERGGGYDGFQVSADLERETFKWLLEHGRPAVSARTPLLSDETMAEVARRFGKKPLMDKVVQEHLRRLDIRDELQRQAEVKAWGQEVEISPAIEKGIGFPGTEAPTFNSGTADQRTKVFISYAHSSPEHKQTVSSLVGTLREKGLAVMVDTDVTTPQGPEEGWPRWMKRQIKDADWVLMFFDELYRRRFDGEEEPYRGLGATWEGAIVTNHFYRDSTRNQKFIPLLADGASGNLVPDEFFGYTRYFIPKQAVELANKLRPSLSDSAGEHSEGNCGAGGGGARGKAGKHV